MHQKHKLPAVTHIYVHVYRGEITAIFPRYTFCEEHFKLWVKLSTLHTQGTEQFEVHT
jgi:hypothetical protein